MASSQRPPKLATPGSGTPDSTERGVTAQFPSTPQTRYTRPVLGLGEGRAVGFTGDTTGGGGGAPAARMPARAKSMGDVPALQKFSHRGHHGSQAPHVALGSGTPTVPLSGPAAGNHLLHGYPFTVINHVEATQIAGMHGVLVIREGFTDSQLGHAAMYVTPTDIVAILASAPQFSHGHTHGSRTATPQGAPPVAPNNGTPSVTTSEGYAAWPHHTACGQGSHPQTPVLSPTTSQLPSYASLLTATHGDRFVLIPRQSIATCVYLPPGAGRQAFNSGEAALREHSLAVAHSLQHQRPVLEVRTRDGAIVTFVFPNHHRSHETIVHELTRAPTVNVFRTSPLRPQPHLAYSVSSLSLRLRFPMKLVAAGLQRASAAGGSLDLGPTIAVHAARGDGAATATGDALTLESPGSPERAAFPVIGQSGAGSGWFVYEPLHELERQMNAAAGCTRPSPSAAAPAGFEQVNASDTWPVRECYVNAEYAICDSYPPVLFVPREVTDAVVIAEAKTRARNRVQTCAYVYAPTRCCLFRASQPCNGKGILGWIVPGEASPLTEAIRLCCASQELKVVDLRPYKNAFANSLFRSGGHESTRRSGTEVLFANIENVDHVNKAYYEVLALFQQHNSAPGCPRSTTATPSQFLAAVAATSWLDLLHTIIVAAVKVARFIAGVPPEGEAKARRGQGEDRAQGCNVLIHCSDGWDRTAQVSALVQILLDPWFRTVKGFCTLVEKEFLHFGHQFASRAHHPRVSTLGGDDYPAEAGYQLPSRTEAGDSQRGGDDVDDDWDRSDAPTDANSPAPSPSPLRGVGGGKHRKSSTSGHSSHVKPGGRSSEGCPIFVQFIDAVHQLVRIYPAMFEFTPQLLIWLLDAYHSGFYASFACDNHRQLIESGLVGKHTANAFGEIAVLGAPPRGPESPTNAPSGETSLKGSKTTAPRRQSQRQTAAPSPSYIDVAALLEGADTSMHTPPPDEPEDVKDSGPGSTPETNLPPQDYSVVGPLVNRLFCWEHAQAQGPLLGLISPQRLQLWEEYFGRFSDDMQPLAVHARVAIPPDAVAVRRLGKLVGGSVESFDNMSGNDWQSVGSRVESPNVFGPGFPRSATRGDDSPAPPSPGKLSRPTGSVKMLPFQRRALQETFQTGPPPPST